MKFLRALPLKEVPFFLLAVACSFCITFDYAITRPVSHSIFITTFGAKMLPYAWLLTVPLNLCIVSLYNRYLVRIGPLKMVGAILSVSIVMNTLGGLWISQVASLSFAHFMWKEIAVLLMFQQVWSIVHTTAKQENAKYLYGLMFALGGIGGACGSIIPSFLAITYGSQNLLFLTLPIFIAFFFFYKKLVTLRYALAPIDLKQEKKRGGFALIKKSSVLQFILLIVVFMQIGSAIVDYQFSSFLEKTFTSTDLRTAFEGKVYGIISSAKIFFQLVGTYLVVHFMGLRLSHFLVPSILLCNAVLVVIFPGFSMITYAFSTIKSFDYSIFNIQKKLLSLPLKSEEKFKAKAVIDVFAYRSSKAVASILIIGLQFLQVNPVAQSIGITSVVIFAFWLATVSLLYNSTKTNYMRGI
ncbi:MAG: Npt1/Npt2 family nucleotide transporter, partial [Simkaniaceae bacterium]|nr:Npt1/Npt2 family nucleotide transporter [Simkaniaceae bacterium]